MDRRQMLFGAAAGTLLPTGLAQAQTALVGGLLPMRLSPREIFRTTVCLRPFRATGPRIEAQKIGRKTVIHNYGHGGSGWSLSWGSAAEAVSLAAPLKTRKVAVVGAGAIGLTTALTAQRAGHDVTIYAKDRYPFVRSGGATGTWTPDSRVALASAAPAGFADAWERMARRSWTMHNAYVGLPGDPVEWMDQYFMTMAMDPALIPANLGPDPGCVHLGDRIGDIVPHGHFVPPEAHPFNAEEVTLRNVLTFNVAAYAHQLEQDFLAAGGRFVPATFMTPDDVAHLPEHVIFNCTGYGAKTLWSDDSILPVRGQITWLAPQQGIHYGFRYKGVMALARRDGIVIQVVGPNDAVGWNDANEEPDMDAARLSVELLRDAYRPA